jgi:hypothetical protein
MTLKNRWLWLGAIAILVLLLLSLFVAPHAPNLRQGSTYSRTPSGYGAWYAYLENQGISVQRWQHPIGDLTRSPHHPEKPLKQTAVPIRFSSQPQTQALVSRPNAPITLVQIDNGLGWFDLPDLDWVKQGNVLVLLGGNPLGLKPSVTAAPFRSVLASPVGNVAIETSRRYLDRDNLSLGVADASPPDSMLSDSYGAIVQAVSLDQGQIIVAATPHLAANAYQDEPGNFKFLAKLVTEPGHPVWIDEYIHGYKDREVIAKETAGSLIGYLIKTPLALVALQASILLLILIWSLNHRMGPATKLTAPSVDNSEAYIQALASVLQKANCHEFVVETIGKAEQLHIQRSLGLGTDLLDPETVAAAWEQQTGRPAADLRQALQFRHRQTHISEPALQNWLNQLVLIRHSLPN